MGKHDDLVRIATLHDLVRADMLKEYLESYGIRVAVPGAQHRAMLGGAFAPYIELPVLVPKSRADEARDLIRAFDEGSEVAESDLAAEAEAAAGGAEADPEPAPPPEPEPRVVRGHPYRSRAPKTTEPSPRLRRIVPIVALSVTFGAGHFYAREYFAGLTLLCAEVCAFWVAMTGRASAVLAIPILVLVDLVGAMRACTRHNQGRPRSPAMQVAVTTALAASAFVVSMVVVPAIEQARAEAAAEAWRRTHPHDDRVEELENFGTDDPVRPSRDYLHLYDPAVPLTPPASPPAPP